MSPSDNAAFGRRPHRTDFSGGDDGSEPASMRVQGKSRLANSLAYQLTTGVLWISVPEGGDQLGFRPLLVVEPRLKNDQVVAVNEVHQAVFFGDAA